MTEELQQYIAIGLLILVACGVVVVMLMISSIIGQRRTHSVVKDAPYECGMPAGAAVQTRFGVKFYLVAMLFVLFDIEVVFFLGWAAVYRDLLKETGGQMLVGGLVFLALLEVGHIYAWKKGALDWAPVRRSSEERGASSATT